MGKLPDLETGSSPDSRGYKLLNQNADDILHGTSVSAAELKIRLGFLKKVFGILSAQLLLTTLVGVVFMTVPTIKLAVQSAPWTLFVGMIASFGLLLALFVKQRETPLNYVLLTLWTLCMSCMVGVTVSMSDKVVVVEAFFLTTCVVLALFAYTFQTKRDFTGWGPGLFSVLWILIIAGFLQMIFWNPVMEFAIAVGGAILFSFYIIYDLQMIMYRLSAEDYITATVNLYLDILNLFLHILRILQAVNRN